MANSIRDKYAKRKKDIARARRFLEEFSWLIDSYSDLDFRSLEDIAYEKLKSEKNMDSMASYKSKNPNIHFMVGVLPIILNDRKIFATNEDIATFSSEVLKYEVTYWQKRSKYEIIGNIICNTYKLNDKGLSKLVRALTKLVQGDNQAKNILKYKKNKSISWNQVIEELSRMK